MKLEITNMINGFKGGSDNSIIAKDFKLEESAQVNMFGDGSESYKLTVKLTKGFILSFKACSLEELKLITYKKLKSFKEYLLRLEDVRELEIIKDELRNVKEQSQALELYMNFYESAEVDNIEKYKEELKSYKETEEGLELEIKNFEVVKKNDFEHLKRNISYY